MKMRRRFLFSFRALALGSALAARCVAEELPMLVVPPTQAATPVPEGLRPALILGAGSTDRFTAVPAEDRLPAGATPRSCFDAYCGSHLAKKTGASYVLLSALRTDKNGERRLLLALYVPAERHVRALWRHVAPDSLVGTARDAAADLCAGRGVIAEGRWEDVHWLSDRDSTDRNRIFRYGLFAALAAAGGVALAENQVKADPVSAAPLALGSDPASEESELRGFFASPPLDARVQGRGGAGAGLAADALATLNNPAALGLLQHPDLVLAHTLAADGSPLLTAAFAAPTSGPWSQGVALHYAGDALESEATMGWGGAYDAGVLADPLAGVFVGATGKLYLAQVGEDGTGQDRSRGRVTGLGLDLGAVLPLEDHLQVSFVLRDLLSFLWERNDFTNDAGSEVLPPEFRAATVANAPGDLRFFLEGDRALLPDAPVDIRIGAEKGFYRILTARTGFHQVFGSETVRTLSAGFGLDTRNLRIGPALALDYAFEYGLGDAQELAQGQEFSLEMRF